MIPIKVPCHVYSSCNELSICTMNSISTNNCCVKVFNFPQISLTLQENGDLSDGTLDYHFDNEGHGRESNDRTSVSSFEEDFLPNSTSYCSLESVYRILLGLSVVMCQDGEFVTGNFYLHILCYSACENGCEVGGIRAMTANLLVFHMVACDLMYTI